jgi:hypothetical protein
MLYLEILKVTQNVNNHRYLHKFFVAEGFHFWHFWIVAALINSQLCAFSGVEKLPLI